MADSRTAFVCISFGLATWLAWKFRFKGTLAAAALLIGVVLLKSSNSPYIGQGMDTYNGRSMYGAFEEHKIAQAPVLGYGYGIAVRPES